MLKKQFVLILFIEFLYYTEPKQKIYAKIKQGNLNGV